MVVILKFHYLGIANKYLKQKCECVQSIINSFMKSFKLEKLNSFREKFEFDNISQNLQELEKILKSHIVPKIQHFILLSEDVNKISLETSSLLFTKDSLKKTIELLHHDIQFYKNSFLIKEQDQSHEKEIIISDEIPISSREIQNQISVLDQEILKLKDKLMKFGVFNFALNAENIIEMRIKKEIRMLQDELNKF